MDIYNEIEQLKTGQVKIMELLALKQNDTRGLMYDNNDLIRLLHVSRRTLATWRGEGKISYTQVGNKIYYTHSDVEEFLKKHKQKSFK